MTGAVVRTVRFGLSTVVAMQMRTQNPGVQKLLFGAFGLPFGLALIVICGADLYTANTAFLPAAFYEVRRSECANGMHQAPLKANC